MKFVLQHEPLVQQLKLQRTVVLRFNLSPQTQE